MRFRALLSIFLSVSTIPRLVFATRDTMEDEHRSNKADAKEMLNVEQGGHNLRVRRHLMPQTRQGPGRGQSQGQVGQGQDQGPGQEVQAILDKLRDESLQGNPVDQNEFARAKALMTEELNFDPKIKEFKDAAIAVLEKYNGTDVSDYSEDDFAIFEKQLMSEVIDGLQSQDLKERLSSDIANGFSIPDADADIDHYAGEDDFDPDFLEGDVGQRNLGVVATPNKWPYGVIPFYVVRSSTIDETYNEKVLPAMVELENAIGVDFQYQGYIRADTPKENGMVYVEDVLDQCFCTLGYHFDKNHRVNIGPGCSRGNTLHEFLHLLGMHHQHVAYYRDSYVTVYIENVKTGREHNFKKLGSNHGWEFGYDYGSIMHYGERTFSNNGAKTIDCRGHGCGQRERLSFWDQKEMIYFYKYNLYKRNPNLGNSTI